MPGFTLIKNIGKSTQKNLSLIEGYNKRVKGRSDYIVTELFSSNSYSLIFNGYKEYPIKEIVIENHKIFIEGKIYNQNDNEIGRIFQNIVNLSLRSSHLDEISKELEKIDGEFLAVAIDMVTNNFFIYNDIFGHLPTYYFITEDKFLISREFTLIYNFADNLEMDHIGVAQTICFGYNVGKRTNYKNCNYLLPGSEISHIKNKLVIRNIHTFNFETLSKPHVSFKKAVIRLSNLFKNACFSRVEKSAIVAISGGLDSRLIAGVLKDNQSTSYVTRLSKNLKEKNEIKIAKEIANDLGLTHTIFDNIEATGESMEHLILSKSGFNSLENAFNLNYEIKVREQYGRRINYITGDGGDRIKPHVKFNKILHSDEDLANLIIDNNSKIPLETICQALDIKSKDFINDLVLYLNALPEIAFNYKYIHFMIYESAFKYVFEGGDRKREFFWTTTPFYQTEFFIASMSTSENYKKHYKLFSALLKSYNEKLIKYKNEDWNFSLDSWKFKIYISLSGLILKYMPRKIKDIFKNNINVNDIYDYNISILEKFSREYTVDKSLIIPLSILKQVKWKSMSVFWNTLTPFLVVLYHKEKPMFKKILNAFKF